MVKTNKYLYIISRKGFIRQAKNPLIYGISCIDEVKNEVSRIGGKFWNLYNIVCFSVSGIPREFIEMEMPVDLQFYVVI